MAFLLLSGDESVVRAFWSRKTVFVEIPEFVPFFFIGTCLRYCPDADSDSFHCIVSNDVPY